MTSLTTDQNGSWELTVGSRQQRLAETLRSLVAQTSADTDAAWSVELVELADALDGEVIDGAALASLMSAVDATCAQVGARIVSQPLLAARRINAALERMQATNTWNDVLRAAPAELCAAGDFDRVLFSRIEGSTWVPATWHVTTDRTSAINVAFGRYCQGARIPLSNGMIEAEIVRRRVTALVVDADAESRTFAPLVDVGHVHSYVIAPVVSGDAVVGLIHADTYGTGRALTEADRATMRAFADGVGLLLERLALQERLEQQRARIAAALTSAAQMVDDLCTAPVLLAGGSDSGADPAVSTAEPAVHDGLTAREREVFSLLVRGATNSQIANRLTVSETTVKSHVKHILRKLRASNRAEAIAKYLVMSGQGRRA